MNNKKAEDSLDNTEQADNQVDGLNADSEPLFEGDTINIEAEESGSDDVEQDEQEAGDVDISDEFVQLQSENVALKEAILRAKAEAENIKRRAEKDVVSARKFALEGFVKQLLDVKDSLDQANKVDWDDSADVTLVEQMKAGLALTLKQLDTAFERYSVRVVSADAGEKFNPELHQAISMVASDEVDANGIISVVQTGFTLNDRLIRPAMVIVAKK